MGIGEMRCEVLPVEGAYNIRDIGGYVNREGREIRKRRFIRGGALHQLTQAGEQALHDLGVRCIVDLRSQAEVDRMPDRLAEHPDISYHHTPMLDYIQSNIDQDLLTIPSSMEIMYCGLLDKEPDKFAKIFKLFADSAHTTTLFHCTAGKDRTGVTAMLLLQLAGVPDELIVEDYSWSEQLGMPIDLDKTVFPAYLFQSRPFTMEETLAHLYKTYGGAAAYLKKAGVTEEEQARILNKLLD